MIDTEEIEGLALMVRLRKRIAVAARRDYDNLGSSRLELAISRENDYLLALQTYVAAVAHNARAEAESIPE